MSRHPRDTLVGHSGARRPALWATPSGTPRFGCSFFAYSWQLPLIVGLFYLQVTIDNFSFFTYSWSFLAYNGKVRQTLGDLRDCKRRSLTVLAKKKLQLCKCTSFHPVFGDSLGDTPVTPPPPKGRETPVAGRGVRKTINQSFPFHFLFSKQGSTPTPWARGLQDQIQKWARQTQKNLYF